MIDWQAPSVIRYCGFLSDQAVIFLLGFLGNHVITRMDIEWSLVTRRRRFNAVLIPYLLGRYSLLVVLLVYVIQRRFHLEVACQATYKLLGLLGSVASFCSTLNLGIRTYIIWKDMNQWVVWALSFGCVGHAALVCLQSIDSAVFAWDARAHTCILVRSSSVVMFAFYLYTMVADLVILLLTVCGLWKKSALRSAIGEALSEQCLWYCVGTFIATVPAVVFPALNLNAILNVLPSIPATTFSVIMSSAAVLSLTPDEVDKPPTAATMTQTRDITMGGVGGTTHDTRLSVDYLSSIAFESRTDSADFELELPFDGRLAKSEETASTIV